MRFRLRTLMVAVLMVCVAASFHERIQVWWWSYTRPEVTFVGNTFDGRELACIAGVPLFAELTPQQSKDGINEITRTYRMMGFLEARIGIQRIATNRGWATRFVVDEGQRYDADEVSGIAAGGVSGMNCTRHGKYLYVAGGDPLTTHHHCPICDRTRR